MVGRQLDEKVDEMVQALHRFTPYEQSQIMGWKSRRDSGDSFDRQDMQYVRELHEKL